MWEPASASKLVIVREALPLAGGALRLGVVADTHSAPHPRTAELLAALKPDRILHAGDVGALRVLAELEKIAPVSAVRGNIDVNAAPDLPDVRVLDLTEEGATRLRILLLHIAVYGPKLRGDAAKLARAEGAQLVVCGHAHVPFLGRDKGFTIFNPGSIGPKRFHLPIVFGVLEIANGRVDARHIDCVTGERWLP